MKVKAITQFLASILCVILLASNWSVIAQVSRLEDSFYFPIAVRYGVGALTLLLLHRVFERERTGFSFRLFLSSLSLGLLGYVIPGVINFFVFRETPSFLGPAFTMLIPLGMGLIFITSTGQKKTIFLFALAEGVAIFLFLFGALEHESWEKKGFLLGLLGAGMISQVLAISSIRKVFFLHSILALNTFALLFSAAFLGLLGWLSNDNLNVQNSSYLIGICYLGIGIDAVGLYLYHSIKVIRSRAFALAIVAGSYFLTVVLVNDYPANKWIVIGALVSLLPFLLGDVSFERSLWLSHFPVGGKRRGERIACYLNGFLLSEGNMIPILVVDLSITGVGFLCGTKVAPGDKPQLMLPLFEASWSQLTLDSQIVNISPSDNKSFPWRGGLRFLMANDKELQLLAEFIGKFSEKSGATELSAVNPPRRKIG